MNEKLLFSLVQYVTLSLSFLPCLSGASNQLIGNTLNVFIVVVKELKYYFGEVSSISLAHLSQYLSITVAPST